MKVSVCIPTFNQHPYLQQAVRSCVRQTQLPYEIIVSDDHSTDKTKEILKNLCTEISFLKVIYQPQNLGISKNTDSCLRLAKGELIIRLDSDDYLHPEYIKTLSEILLKYPNAGYAHAAVQEIDEKGNFRQIRKLFRGRGFQSGDDALKVALKGYRVAANIIMFRREALEKVNYLSGRPDYVEDYHLSASLAAAGYGNVYLDKTLSFYRVWIDTAKVRQKRKLAEIIGLRRVFEEVIEPAYKERGWKTSGIKKSRKNFALWQTDCLGWNIYNKNEKEQLSFELLTLSSDFQVRFSIWLYLKGFTKLMNTSLFLKSIPRKLIKKLII